MTAAQQINNALAEIDIIEQGVTKRRVIECLAEIEAVLNMANGWATAVNASLAAQRAIIQENDHNA